MTAFASVVLPRTVAGPDGGNSIPSTFNYTTLRTYVPIVPISGGAQIYVRAPGIEGLFVYDATDTTTADNACTIIVNATKGWRWKRQYYGLLYAEWAGASESATAAVNTTAWQAAIDATGASTDSAGVPPALTWAGEHTVNATLNVDLTTLRGFRMVGNGTTLDGRGSRLRAATTFTGSALLQLQGDAAALDAIDTFELDNFALLAQAGSSCTVGLKIGETAKLVDAVVTNKVTRLSVEGFPIEVLAVNARDIYWGLNIFSATGVVGGTAFRLETDSVAFQSDGHDFEGNTFVGPVGSGKCFSIYNATNGAALKGISFYGRNKIYNGATAMEINAGASGAIIGDIFIGGDTQFDNVEDGIVVSAAAGSIVEGVYCRGNYFACLTANKFAFKADIAATGRVKQIEFCGNAVKYYPDQPVLLNNVDTIQHEGNEYFQVHSDTSVVKFDGCSNVVHGGNVLAKGPDGAAQYFVEFASDCSGITIYPDQADPAALSIGVINDATYKLDLQVENWLVKYDGTTCTTGLQAAMDWGSAAGGRDFLLLGVVTTGKLVPKRGVSFHGIGFANPGFQTAPPALCGFKRANGVNDHLFAWPLSQNNGQNSFRNLIIDGNSANNASGDCFYMAPAVWDNLNTYICDWNLVLADLQVKNFATGKWLNNVFACRGGFVENVWIDNCGEGLIGTSDWTVKDLKGGANTAASVLTIKASRTRVIGGDLFTNLRAIDVQPSDVLTSTGTARGGGASSITLAATAWSATNDYYTGASINISSGTGSGQTRTLGAGVGATGVYDVTVAWGTPPDATSVYTITGFAIAAEGVLIDHVGIDLAQQEGIRLGLNCRASIVGCDFISCGLAANNTHPVIRVGTGSVVELAGNDFRRDPNQSNFPNYLVYFDGAADAVNWAANGVQASSYVTAISNLMANLRTYAANGTSYIDGNGLLYGVKIGLNTTPLDVIDAATAVANSETGAANLRLSYSVDPTYFNSITSFFSGTQSDDRMSFNVTYAGTKVTPLACIATGQIRIGSLGSAPASPQNGDVYYDTGTSKLRVRAGGAWVDLH